MEITLEKDENENIHMQIIGNGENTQKAKEEISEIIDIQQQNLIAANFTNNVLFFCGAYEPINS